MSHDIIDYVNEIKAPILQFFKETLFDPDSKEAITIKANQFKVA